MGSKVCPRCTIHHEKTGTYCSRKCANVRQWSAEINERRRTKALSWSQSEENKRQLKSRKENNTKAQQIRRFEQRHSSDTKSLGRTSLRKRILEEQGFKCKRCELNKWLEQEMPYELNHIDGNNQNNERSNLEMLCPNCHALTPTWRGRKKGLINSGRIIIVL